MANEQQLLRFRAVQDALNEIIKNVNTTQAALNELYKESKSLSAAPKKTTPITTTTYAQQEDSSDSDSSEEDEPITKSATKTPQPAPAEKKCKSVRAHTPRYNATDLVSESFTWSKKNGALSGLLYLKDASGIRTGQKRHMMFGNAKTEEQLRRLGLDPKFAKIIESVPTGDSAEPKQPKRRSALKSTIPPVQQGGKEKDHFEVRQPLLHPTTVNSSQLAELQQMLQF